MSQSQYAEIVRGIGNQPYIVVSKGNASFGPALMFPPESTQMAVDITDIKPEPNIGDWYHPDTNTFTLPPPKPELIVKSVVGVEIDEKAGQTFQVNEELTEATLTLGVALRTD
ncbi:MAG: hypothetical protein LBH03_03015, partial [Holophagales bacterium]|nr:hypothetical protein [Holophagales bacterium]